MLLNNPKKVATMIVGKLSPKIEGPKGPEDMEEASTSDYESGYEAAAQQMLDAIAAKDVKKFVQTMKDFHEMYDAEMEEEEESTEEMEETED